MGEIQSLKTDFLKTILNVLLRGLSGKESACQCRRHGFDPWVGKILWRRKWQPTPVFLPGIKPRSPTLQMDSLPAEVQGKPYSKPNSKPNIKASLIAQLVRIHLQCRRSQFDSWVGKIPWRRDRIPTPVFWTGEFQGLYSPWVIKGWIRLSNFHFQLSFGMSILLRLKISGLKEIKKS